MLPHRVEAIDCAPAWDVVRSFPQEIVTSAAEAWATRTKEGRLLPSLPKATGSYATAALVYASILSCNMHAWHTARVRLTIRSTTTEMGVHLPPDQWSPTTSQDDDDSATTQGQDTARARIPALPLGPLLYTRQEPTCVRVPSLRQESQAGPGYCSKLVPLHFLGPMGDRTRDDDKPTKGS